MGDNTGEKRLLIRRGRKVTTKMGFLMGKAGNDRNYCMCSVKRKSFIVNNAVGSGVGIFVGVSVDITVNITRGGQKKFKL